MNGLIHLWSRVASIQQRLECLYEFQFWGRLLHTPERLYTPIKVRDYQNV